MSEPLQQPAPTVPTTLSGLVSRSVEIAPAPPAEVKAAPRYAGKYPIEIAQAAYIEYCAASGKRVDEAGNWYKYPVTKFAADLGIDRTTLYYWQKSIPNFWAKVRARLRELAGGARTAAVWDSVFMSARAGKSESQKIWLANHDPEYKVPTEKKEIDLGPGFAGLLVEHRRTQLREAQEGEFTDATNS